MSEGRRTNIQRKGKALTGRCTLTHTLLRSFLCLSLRSISTQNALRSM